MNAQPEVAAIIAAAGESRRMGGEDKVFASLGNRPVLAVTVAAFEACPVINRIIVVVNRQNEAKCRQLGAEYDWHKVSICIGGTRRQDSVAAGLAQIGGCDWVVIHDGARPLVTADLITAGLEAARETGAAVAAVPVTDTIKMADDNKIITRTIPRQQLWAAQTPQVFRVDIIVEAYRRADAIVTDDAALVEQTGYRVKLYPGTPDNLKITTPGDLVISEALLKERAA